MFNKNMILQLSEMKAKPTSYVMSVFPSYPRLQFSVPISLLPFLMAPSSFAFTHLSVFQALVVCVFVNKQKANNSVLRPFSRHPVAMVYGALFAGLYVGLPWQGLFAILNVWQHCTDADDKHPTSHFDQ